MAEHDVVSEFEAYLAANEHKSLLRFLTCGSVDDGKSSLIGRLLHDSKLIYDDQLAAIKRDSRKFNTTDQEMDLNVSRGSPLMLLIVISQPIVANLSLPIHRAMSSTPETWQLGLLIAIWRSFWWMPAVA